jgi:hypothetical protein
VALANVDSAGLRCSFQCSFRGDVAAEPLPVAEQRPPNRSLDDVVDALAHRDLFSEAVKGTALRIGDAIDAGRKPGMPLSILSNIVREAPLGSLLVAFLLGVAVARRRSSW